MLYINGIGDQIYRVTQITNVQGAAPNLTAQFRISPSLKENESPDHEEEMTIRQQYSQVRLTGHDLDIGTGGFTTTNYPKFTQTQDLQKDMKHNLPEKQQTTVVVEYSIHQLTKMVTSVLVNCLKLNRQLVL